MGYTCNSGFWFICPSQFDREISEKFSHYARPRERKLDKAIKEPILVWCVNLDAVFQAPRGAWFVSHSHQCLAASSMRSHDVQPPCVLERGGLHSDEYISWWYLLR